MTSAVRDLPGDTGPVVAAVRACTGWVLLVGFVAVVFWRRASGRRDRALRSTQERFRAVYGASPAGMVETDLEQRIVNCNAAFGAMLGLEGRDILGHHGWEFFHPDSPPPDVAAVQELVAGVRSSYSAVRLLRAPDGSPLTVKLDWAAIADGSGVVMHLALVVTDISEQARTAAELVRRQSFTDALLETIDVGVVSCDADTGRLSRNRAERAMLGLAIDDTDATSATVRARMEIRALDGALVAPEDYPIQSALDGRGPSLQELLMGPRGGSHRQVVVRTNCITSPDGTLLGAVSALTDVTAERAITRELAQESSRLVEAQRLGQLGSFTLDVAKESFTFSQEMYRIWGLPQGAELAAVPMGMIHPDDLAAVRTNWAAALVAGGRHASAYRITRPDGSIRHLRVQLDVKLGPDGSAIRVRGTHLDVTDLEVARIEAAEASVLVSAVLVATPDFTFVTNLATGAVVYAPPGKDILGITSETLVEHGTGAIAALVHPEDQGRLRAANVDAADLDDGEVLQISYRLQHTDGSWHWLNRRVTPFHRDANGRVVEVLGVVRDVTDMVEAESRLQHSALHDPLTGLPNRALLMDRLEAALGRAMQTGREAAVLFCDLDGFKRVNDTAGHPAGDAVLIETTRRMRAVLREQDTVARVGGDEFVVIVEPWQREPGGAPNDGTNGGLGNDRALAVELAERLTMALRQPVTVDGVEHVVTASIGIAYAGTVGVTADDVLRDADAAMYRAKHGGKDRFEVFEHGLRADLAERGRVEQLLRRAVAPTMVPTLRGTPTLAAAYQPVVDKATGALVGFEALARLSDGQGGTIPPDVFIPVAEATALIRPLGMLMLDQACGQLARWRRTVPGMAHVTMAVNVSALQAQHASLLDDVRDTLRTHGLTATDLVLELTESSLLQAGPSTLTALRTLREDGVGIAIDDFGTGYASLSYLVTLPVSAVKVDRSFTAGLPHDQTCRTIVRAVVGLAADLNLTCIVEGVETEAQRSALPAGVQLQGWLTGRPALEPDVAALLAGNVSPDSCPVFQQ